MAKAYGCRFSAADLAVLAIGAAATWWLWPLVGSVAALIPVALVHFFLFCNVFRVRRRPELLWAALFVVNFAVWRWAGFSWLGVLAVQTPITVAVIWIEVRSPRYHGVWARRLNPELDAYLSERPLDEQARKDQAHDAHELDQDV